MEISKEYSIIGEIHQRTYTDAMMEGKIIIERERVEIFLANPGSENLFDILRITGIITNRIGVDNKRIKVVVRGDKPKKELEKIADSIGTCFEKQTCPVSCYTILTEKN